MSVPYNTVLREVALRINALVGTSDTLLEASYVVNPLTATQFQSTIFNFTSIKDAIIDTEGRLIQAVADTGDSPLRQYIASTTGSIANAGTLPSVDTGFIPIIGIWGAVIDSSDSIPCSMMPLDMVRRRARNANTTYVCPVYWYNMPGGRIEHTRTTVKVECCIYNRATQSTSFDSNGNILLSDALTQAYVAGALAMLLRDDEFAEQGQLYNKYFDAAITAIRSGLTSVPGSVPTP